jgi:hypothetical protein
MRTSMEDTLEDTPNITSGKHLGDIQEDTSGRHFGGYSRVRLRRTPKIFSVVSSGVSSGVFIGVSYGVSFEGVLWGFLRGVLWGVLQGDLQRCQPGVLQGVVKGVLRIISLGTETGGQPRVASHQGSMDNRRVQVFSLGIKSASSGTEATII